MRFLNERFLCLGQTPRESLREILIREETKQPQDNFACPEKGGNGPQLYIHTSQRHIKSSPNYSFLSRISSFHLQAIFLFRSFFFFLEFSLVRRQSQSGPRVDVSIIYIFLSSAHKKIYQRHFSESRQFVPKFITNAIASINEINR